MDYQGFTSWMFNLERFGIKLGLENVAEFHEMIGNPQKDLRAIHVTGTNGKGSVCAFIAEILRQSGLKVGLYTSPHLVDFRERIRINGEDIPEAEVIRIGLDLKKAMDQMALEDSEKQLTFFEFTTGLAFRYFSEQKVDIVVAEVGMGGRLDATNILMPEVGVITRIGLEHTNYLGTTIPDIAREKAGIIKPGMKMITCERKDEALSVILNTCQKKGVELKRIGEAFDVSDVRQSISRTAFDYIGASVLKDLEVRLLGGYQAENAAAAIAAVEAENDLGANITRSAIRKGLERTRWPGRLEVVSTRPLLIFDGSHNPDGISKTSLILKELGVTPLTFVVGCMDDKDAVGIIRPLVPIASRIVVTQAKYKRALPAERLGQIVKNEFQGRIDIEPDSSRAIELALAATEGKGVCVIGSLYVVGEAIQWRNQHHGKH